MLIGISGMIGSGKSTIAEYLVSKYEFVEYMIAKPLKEIGLIFGFEHHQMFGTQQQKLEINEFLGISGRQFLQVFGTEVCRKYIPKVLPATKFDEISIWIRLFEKYYKNCVYKNTIVSDIRFVDESESIRKLGGIIIKIKRNDLTGDSHQSEKNFDLIEHDYIIHNYGSMDELYIKIDLIINSIKIKNEFH